MQPDHRRHLLTAVSFAPPGSVSGSFLVSFLMLLAALLVALAGGTIAALWRLAKDVMSFHARSSGLSNDDAYLSTPGGGKMQDAETRRDKRRKTRRRPVKSAGHSCQKTVVTASTRDKLGAIKDSKDHNKAQTDGNHLKGILFDV